MSEESAREIAGAVKKNTKLMTLTGVLTVILGVVCLAAPLVAGVAIARVAGYLLVIGGVMRAVLAFKAGSFGKGLPAFLIGLLTLVSGVLILARPLFAVASLTLILALYFLADGLVEIAVGFRTKPNQGWGSLLFGGAVSLILGLLIWRQWPLSGAWAIGTLVGFKLVLAGWEEIAIAVAARSMKSEAGAAGA